MEKGGKIEKEREKLERFERAKYKSTEAKKNAVKEKIDKYFKKLPLRERERIEREEMKANRKELDRITEELWKYREKEKKLNLTKEKE